MYTILVIKYFLSACWHPWWGGTKFSNWLLVETKILELCRYHLDTPGWTLRCSLCSIAFLFLKRKIDPDMKKDFPFKLKENLRALCPGSEKMERGIWGWIRFVGEALQLPWRCRDDWLPVLTWTNRSFSSPGAPSWNTLPTKCRVRAGNRPEVTFLEKKRISHPLWQSLELSHPL